jgi:DNA-3-methyladenine glycosylase
MRRNGRQSDTFLRRSFFERPFLDVARDLIGCTLVWDGCAGVIVELEAYAAEGDPACHTTTRPSARDFVRRQPAGTAYVYLNYGMYWLLNVLVKGGGGDGILLIRAVEPVEGVPLMQQRRGRDSLTELCSGPGKLGVAFALGGGDHGCRLAFTDGRRPRQRRGFLPRADAIDVTTDVRIGISRAAERPWRFLVGASPHISVPPRRSSGVR